MIGQWALLTNEINEYQTFILGFIYLFTYLLTYLFTYVFMYLFIYLFIHLFITLDLFWIFFQWLKPEVPSVSASF